MANTAAYLSYVHSGASHNKECPLPSELTGAMSELLGAQLKLLDKSRHQKPAIVVPATKGTLGGLAPLRSQSSSLSAGDWGWPCTCSSPKFTIIKLNDHVYGVESNVLCHFSNLTGARLSPLGHLAFLPSLWKQKECLPPSAGTGEGLF